MPALSALLIAILTSLLIGIALYFAIRNPLEKLLVQSCPGDAAVAFWTRFSLVMLFLSPLFVSIAFGLPLAEMAPKMDPSTIVSRIITSSLSGAFLTMIGMGLWVSKLANRYPKPVHTEKSDPEARWGTK